MGDNVKMWTGQGGRLWDILREGKEVFGFMNEGQELGESF